jgi:hypothetical protein
MINAMPKVGASVEWKEHPHPDVRIDGDFK